MTLLLSFMCRNVRPFLSIGQNFTSHRALQQRHQSNNAKSAKTFLTVYIAYITDFQTIQEYVVINKDKDNKQIVVFPDCKQYYNIKLTIKDLSSNVPTTYSTGNKSRVICKVIKSSLSLKFLKCMYSTYVLQPCKVCTDLD